MKNELVTKAKQYVSVLETSDVSILLPEEKQYLAEIDKTILALKDAHTTSTLIDLLGEQVKQWELYQSQARELLDRDRKRTETLGLLMPFLFYQELRSLMFVVMNDGPTWPSLNSSMIFLLYHATIPLLVEVSFTKNMLIHETERQGLITRLFTDHRTQFIKALTLSFLLTAYFSKFASGFEDEGSSNQMLANAVSDLATPILVIGFIISGLLMALNHFQDRDKKPMQNPYAQELTTRLRR